MRFSFGLRHVRLVLQVVFILALLIYLSSRSAMVSWIADLIYRRPDLRFTTAFDSPHVPSGDRQRAYHVYVLANNGNGLASDVYVRIRTPGSITRTEISSEVQYTTLPSSDGSTRELAYLIQRFPPAANLRIELWDVQFATHSGPGLEVSASWEGGSVTPTTGPATRDEITGAFDKLTEILANGVSATQSSKYPNPLRLIMDAVSNTFVTEELRRAAVLVLILVAALWVVVPSGAGAVLGGVLIGAFWWLFMDLPLVLGKGAIEHSVMTALVWICATVGLLAVWNANGHRDR